jgi:hypothetical protein
MAGVGLDDEGGGVGVLGVGVDVLGLLHGLRTGARVNKERGRGGRARMGSDSGHSMDVWDWEERQKGI